MYLNILLLSAIASTVIFLLPRQAKGFVALAIVVLGAVMSVAQAVDVLFGGETAIMSYGLHQVIGGGQASIDALSAIFMLIISIVAVSVLIYAKGYMKDSLEHLSPSHISLHYISLVLMFVAMIFVVTARGGFEFLFWWELMTISSFVLILFRAHKREVRRAALGYIILMHIGFVFLLVGFVTLSVNDLPVTFESLGLYFARNNPIPLFLVFLVGFGMKAGVFPVHVWLPDAYSAAPSHVPAFMSGVMSKMGVYGVLRVLSFVDSELLTIGIVLFGVGIVTGLWGVMLATVQSDVKRLLAYSSIENMGIIFIGIGCAVIGRADNNNMLAVCAMSGALLHVVNHSMFKSVLFMGAGNICTQTRSTHIEQMGGLARRMPVTAGVMLVAAVAICGLPPLCGFVSEFLIYYGLLDAVACGNGVISALIGIIALSLIAGVVMIAFTKLYGIVFLGSPRSEAAAMADEVDGFRIGAFALPLTGILVVGLLPFLFIETLMGVSQELIHLDAGVILLPELSGILVNVSLSVAVLIGVIMVCVVVRWLMVRGRESTVSPTWICGFTSPNQYMQYSGESYSEGLQSISTSFTRNTGAGEAVGKDEIFPLQHSFGVERKDKVNTLFAAWWVELVRKINYRVMILRTGKVNYYVLYALMFLVLILLLSLLNLI